MTLWHGRLRTAGAGRRRLLGLHRSLSLSTAGWPADDLAGSRAHVRGLGRAGS